jgi:hypothetical protein
MSARDSPTMNSHLFNSRESSPYSDQKPSDWEETGKDEDSQSTYLECQNQEHYCEKYYKKTGKWPPEMVAPSIIDEGSETEVLATGTDVRG